MNLAVKQWFHRLYVVSDNTDTVDEASYGYSAP